MDDRSADKPAAPTPLLIRGVPAFAKAWPAPAKKTAAISGLDEADSRSTVQPDAQSKTPTL